MVKDTRPAGYVSVEEWRPTDEQVDRFVAFVRATEVQPGEK